MSDDDKRGMVRMRFTETETRLLDEMARAGDWPSRSVMCRSMIRAILDDDAKAHSSCD